MNDYGTVSYTHLQTDAQNEVDYDAVIFAAPDLLVLPESEARSISKGYKSSRRRYYAENRFVRR